MSSAAGLSTIARYAIRSSASNPSKLFSLVISGGSVVDFTHSDRSKAAIVNAANEACLGGGGVDGAIGDAGGPNLLRDRMALPLAAEGVRCPTGRAVMTGPGQYGELGVGYVVHAVGPNYMTYDYAGRSDDSCESSDNHNRNSNYAEGDALLRSAYVDSMRRAAEHGLEAVAFSLISSGIYRGRHSKKEVLQIGVEGIANRFVSEIIGQGNGDVIGQGMCALKEVHLCAFNAEEARLLCEICEELGLERE